MRRWLLGALALALFVLPGAVISTKAHAACGGRVAMISTDWCVHCKHARAFFEANRIPYTDYDVKKLHLYSAAEAEWVKSIRAEHGPSIPKIVVGTELIKGFKEPDLRRALCLRG